MNGHARIGLVWAAGSALGTVSAQPSFSLTRLVQGQSSVPGVGVVTSVERLAVNDAGDWAVSVTTDHADPLRDSLVLVNGAVALREGDAVAAPAGVRVDGVRALALRPDGSLLGIVSLRGTGVSLTNNSALTLGTTIVLREGAACAAPQVSPITFYRGFYRIAPAGGDSWLVTGTLDDVLSAPLVDRAALLLRIGPAGELLGQSAPLRVGQSIGGLPPILDIPPRQGAAVADSSGAAGALVQLSSTFTPDAAVVVAGAVAARTGLPSPLPGRAWGDLSLAGVGLNDNGDSAFRARVGGDPASNEIIVKSGAVFVREGDAPPALGGFRIDRLGDAGPVAIGAAGDIVWWGGWDNSEAGRDSGLFFNDSLAVAEGADAGLGQTIAWLPLHEDGLAVSPNGRWIVFKALLDSGYWGAFRIEVTPGCYPDCDTSTGRGTLDIFDFLCFQNLFDAQDPYACGCDTSTGVGVCDIFDFLCFQNAFAGGCP